jgi:hypothetical protein
MPDRSLLKPEWTSSPERVARFTAADLARRRSGTPYILFAAADIECLGLKSYRQVGERHRHDLKGSPREKLREPGILPSPGILPRILLFARGGASPTARRRPRRDEGALPKATFIDSRRPGAIIATYDLKG